MTNIFNSEDGSRQIVSKVATMRIFVALLRLEGKEKEQVAETFIGHQLGKALIKDSALKSDKDMV